MPTLFRLLARLQNILRRAGIVSAIVAVLGLALAASASAAPLLWTVNNGTNSVSTINTATKAVVGTSIPVAEKPNWIAITPNGKRALVTTFQGDDLTVIETGTRNPVGSLPLTANPEQVVTSPEGTAYLTIESSEKVFVVNPESPAITGSFTVAKEASALAVAPSGKLLYVGSALNAISVIDTSTGKPIRNPIEVGGFPQQIVVTPNGNTVYALVAGVKGIVAINAVSGSTQTIATAVEPEGLAVSPDGTHFYATVGSEVVIGQTNGNTLATVGIPVGAGAAEIALTPDGKTGYVAGGEKVTPVNLAAGRAETSIPLPAGSGASQLVVAPDQSPTAIFSPPAVIAGVPANFSGTASTDPDGSIAAWDWSFGDGATANGSIVDHTYVGPGTYNASLSVIDDEGCGEAEVFTGRTAYCSGNPLAKVVHPVEAKIPPVLCTNRFRFGAIVHNRRNGTVRVQVKLPAAGSLFLFGKKIHAVTRKSVKAGSTFLTLHARVRINKRLKKVHHTRVRYRLTFYPAAGCSPNTKHSSVALLRAPHKRHHR